MGSKIQRIAAIVVIGLVAILIVVKLVINYQAKRVKWQDGDRQALVNQCIDDLAGRAILFPDLTQEYCECSTDALMAQFEKHEYIELETKSFEERKKEMTPVIKDCFNAYNEGMYDNSPMPD